MKYSMRNVKKISQFLRQNAVFFSSVSVVMLFSLFALSFYSLQYIDIVFVVGFILLFILSRTIALSASKLTILALCAISAAGFMLLIGYSKFALVFAQWAYLFLLAMIVSNLVFFFRNKKELLK